MIDLSSRHSVIQGDSIMKFSRFLSLAAAFGITVIQWGLCLGIFPYTQRASAAEVAAEYSVALPEIVVIGHRT
jgi:hypothetical protein